MAYSIIPRIREGDQGREKGRDARTPALLLRIEQLLRTASLITPAASSSLYLSSPHPPYQEKKKAPL
ncbi:MAG: hypothetical protein M3305_10365, partial [Actinomycetota bacterium]|nr:hypothetical protein [Actinomycetota bacterium]